jgi:hypothetical protein
MYIIKSIQSQKGVGVADPLGRQLQRDRDAEAVVVARLSHRKMRPRHPQSGEKAQQAFKKILLATDGRAPVGFGVQHPTQETANGDLV